MRLVPVNKNSIPSCYAGLTWSVPSDGINGVSFASIPIYCLLWPVNRLIGSGIIKPNNIA